MDDRTINRRTLAVVDVISSWVVNTFYNYLHQEAVTIHTSGRTASITDGYKFIVKQYLDSFNTSEGYRRNLMGLHKYYIDNTRYSSIPFDMWIKDILQQFVPADYFPIMSNAQQDTTLRNILVNSIQQFSSDVICTKTIDSLITNHEHPSIVPVMKESMRRSLLFERQRLFQAVFKSSTGSYDKPMELMKKELASLIEENVSIAYKNKKAVIDLKKALDGMKARDKIITNLQNELVQTRAQVRTAYNQKPIKPPTPEETFVSAVSSSTGLQRQNAFAAGDVLINIADEKSKYEERYNESNATSENDADEENNSEDDSFITSSANTVARHTPNTVARHTPNKVAFNVPNEVTFNTPSDESQSKKEEDHGNEITVELDMAEFLES